MNHSHHQVFIEIERRAPTSIWPSVVFAGSVAFFYLAQWLDRLPVDVVGYVLYPIECFLNAVLFPHVMTPLRGDGTALFVLLPTLALFAVLFRVARLSAGLAIRGFRFFLRTRQ